MKGIILAAGKGTRMYPMTKPVCKPLLPVYDKPMISYPLTTLIKAGIRDILVIVPPGDMKLFEDFLGDGSRFGAKISYLEQKVQRGIADAFIIGEEFIGDDNVCLILGDNIFHGENFEKSLEKAMSFERGAAIFGCYVDDPRPFGVVEFDADGNVISIEEKPAEPKSNYIVPGLYFYDNRVVEIAKAIEPSARGELEITSVNNAYLDMKELRVIALPEDFSWFDTGNAESVFKAASAVREIQKGGKMVGSPEAEAYAKGFITSEKLLAMGEEISMTNYGQHLIKLSKEF